MQQSPDPCKNSAAYRIARQTVARWIRKSVQALPCLQEILLPALPENVLEVDELCSLVGKKSQKRWLWTALYRRTRQKVAFVVGDRSEKTCRRLWNKIPDAYQRCLSFSDFWGAYQKVFSKATHRCVDRGSGETAHIERWYNTLRQQLARFVRKSLFFSKSEAFHMVAKWYIVEYNLTISLIQCNHYRKNLSLPFTHHFFMLCALCVLCGEFLQ